MGGEGGRCQAGSAGEECREERGGVGVWGDAGAGAGRCAHVGRGRPWGWAEVTEERGGVSGTFWAGWWGACGPRRDCRGAVRCTPAASLSTSRRGALGGRRRPTAELVKHGKGAFALVACGA